MNLISLFETGRYIGDPKYAITYLEKIHDQGTGRDDEKIYYDLRCKLVNSWEKYKNEKDLKVHKLGEQIDIKEDTNEKENSYF